MPLQFVCISSMRRSVPFNELYLNRWTGKLKSCLFHIDGKSPPDQKNVITFIPQPFPKGCPFCQCSVMKWLGLRKICFHFFRFWRNEPFLTQCVRSIFQQNPSSSPKSNANFWTLSVARWFHYSPYHGGSQQRQTQHWQTLHQLRACWLVLSRTGLSTSIQPVQTRGPSHDQQPCPFHLSVPPEDLQLTQTDPTPSFTPLLRLPVLFRVH